MRFSLANAAFDEAFEIDRTFSISVKAVVEGMIQVFQAEMPGAPVIRAVEERTMVRASAHTTGGDGRTGRRCQRMSSAERTAKREDFARRVGVISYRRSVARKKD